MASGGGIRIGIIGAGMAGLTCAAELARHGVASVLFDKGRGPGGRMATRRAEHQGVTLHFDHGAQYFTAHDPAFSAAIENWLLHGAVARWPAAGAHAYVGTPGMNAPLKYMARDLDVRWGTRIAQVSAMDGGWQMAHADGSEQVSHCVCAIPAEQTAQLLKTAAPQMARFAGRVVSDPCWTVMAAFDAPLPIEPDSIREQTADISWAARNSAKPDRSGPESWVIQASAEYSREYLELDAEDAAQQILARFLAEHAAARVMPAYITAHRWRYAMPRPNTAPRILWDDRQKIGAAGDWLVRPEVEGAWLSGKALAEAVAASL